MNLIKVQIAMRSDDSELAKLGLGDENAFEFLDGYINGDLITSFYKDSDNNNNSCVNFGSDGLVIDMTVDELLEILLLG